MNNWRCVLLDHPDQPTRVHVYPLHDEKPHRLDDTGCSCVPLVVWQDNETGEIFNYPMVIHNAFDCREVVERAQEILDKSTP